MKRLLMVFVFVIMLCTQAWGAYEKSGIIYYPTDGDSFENIIAGIDEREEACTVKLLHKSGSSTAYEIDSGLTVPSYVTLEFENGAYGVIDANITISGLIKGNPQFIVTSGNILTFSLSPDELELTPNHKYFDIGTVSYNSGWVKTGGDVYFGNGGTVYGEWFGLRDDADAHNYYLQLAEDSVPTGEKCLVQLLAYDYRFGIDDTIGTNALYLSSNRTVAGMGKDSTHITAYTSTTVTAFNIDEIGTENVTIKDLSVNGRLILVDDALGSADLGGSGVTNISLLNLRVDGYDYTNNHLGNNLMIEIPAPSKYIRIDNCEFYNHSSIALLGRDWEGLTPSSAVGATDNPMKHVSITNCIFEHKAHNYEDPTDTNYPVCIQFVLAEDVIIKGNTFKNIFSNAQPYGNQGYGLYFGDNGNATIGPRRFVISDNLFINNEDEESGTTEYSDRVMRAVRASYLSDSIINNNTCAGTVIYLTGTDDISTDYISIKNNTFIDGSILANGNNRYLNIIGNTITQGYIRVNSGSNIAYDFLIANNFIKESNNVGILIGGTKELTRNGLIIGNMILDCNTEQSSDVGNRSAINLYGTPDNISIYNNYMANTPSGDGRMAYGMEFSVSGSSTTVRYNGNTILGSTASREALGAYEEEPTTGTWIKGDFVQRLTTALNPGTVWGWVCTDTGTFGNGEATGGEITLGSGIITDLTDADDEFYAGDYVDISAGFAARPLCVKSVSGTTMELWSTATSTESNVTITHSVPDFGSVSTDS